MKKKHDDRAYQKEIEDAIFEYLFEEEGNPIAASPGGTGKSFVMAKLMKKLVTKWPGTRVIQLAQDAKLLDQNCNELLRLWPEAPVGIYSAGLKSRDTTHPIIFAGIQSCAKRAKEFGRMHIGIVDECDLLSPEEETLYQVFYNEMRKMNSKFRLIGFTATPYRMKTGCLTNLDIWDKIVIDLTRTERFNWFIEHGFLCPLVNKRGAREIDIVNIPMKGGDFDEKAMQEIADTDELNKCVVEECIRYGSDRKHWLVFASGVKHGERLTKLFNAKGVSAVMLTGKDTMKHREEMETRFRNGEIRCLVNVGLYGRGWNFPALDMIAWARATQSVQLWVQGCVRLTRTHDGKQNGLVLDFAGNTRRLGPVNAPIVPAPRRKGDAEKGEAPVKECPECHSYIHTRTMVCPDCGYQFPTPKTIKERADDAAILAGGANALPQIEDFYVRSVRYKGKISKAGNPYMEVLYGVGTERFREFVHFGSENAYHMRRTEQWWKHRGGELPPPQSVEEGVERAHHELKLPTVIRVDVAKKWPEVVGCDFNTDAKISDGDSDFTVDGPQLESQAPSTDLYIDDDDIPF